MSYDAAGAGSREIPVESGDEDPLEAGAGGPDGGQERGADPPADGAGGPDGGQERGADPPGGGLSGLPRDELLALALEQKSRLEGYEEKLKRSLADFANLQKKTADDVRAGVNNQLDRCFLDFLQIYDDFARAKEAYAAGGADTRGLDSILRNMDSFLSKYQVTAIDALGEIFDPNYHEAISVASDPALDDDTVTKEIRKGYISHNRVIRPALVEISKKGA